MKNILILILSFSFLNSQDFDRTKKPAPLVTPKLTLPKIQRAELSNGLKILLVEHHEMPVFQMQLVFQSGSSNDEPLKAGVANLTAQMLDEGTGKRSALQISDDLEYLGTNLSISSSQDASVAGMLALKEQIDPSIEIFADVILNPTFPKDEWDRIKKTHLTSLLQRKDQPGQIASLVFSKLLYNDSHPYGRPTSGTETTVNAIEISDLKNYYNTFYRPNNATVICVGDVNLKELTNLLTKYFGKWEGKTIPQPVFTTTNPLKENKILVVDKPQAAQSEVRIGHFGVSRNNSDYYSITVMNAILGGQFSSRINMNLRESKGYTYGASSSFAMRKEAGPFIAAGAFRTNVTDSSVIEIMSELNKIVNEDVSKKELDQAVNSIVRGQPGEFETPQQISGKLMELVLYNLPDDYFNTSIQSFEKITLADVRNAAKKYINPNKLNIVLVGDVSVTLAGLEKLGYGKVELVDSEGNPKK